MVTRKEVAERAKVSVTAVSRTLNSNGYVAKEKKEAILQAAAELGYRPNPIARSLKRQRTRQILFYCKDLSNPFNMELYIGMHKYARTREYMILMSGSLDFQQMNGMMIDGAVLPNDTIAEAYERQGYCRSGLPVVSASYGVSLKGTRDIPYVDCDVYAAMEKAIAYLRAKGHTLIALATPYDVFAELGLSRQIAYLNQMRPLLGKNLNRYVFDRYLNTYNPFLEEDFFAEGQRAAEEFVKRGSDATAVVCFNDEFAMGMLKQFHLLGVQVPEDVSVMGIDGTRIRRYVTPTLTSVSLSAARQGAECIRILLEVIEGQHVRSLTPVPLGLIEGESVRNLLNSLDRKNHTIKKFQLSGGKALNIVSCFSFLYRYNNDIRYTFRTLSKTAREFCSSAGSAPVFFRFDK